MGQTLLVIFLLALIVLPIIIAYHRQHYRKKQIIAIFAGSLEKMGGLYD